MEIIEDNKLSPIQGRLTRANVEKACCGLKSRKNSVIEPNVSKNGRTIFPTLPTVFMTAAASDRSHPLRQNELNTLQ